MEDLSDCLDQSKWVKVDASEKKDFVEVHMTKQHKQLTPTSFKYLVQPENSDDPVDCVIEGTVKGKDPLKAVGTAEFLIKDGKVVGIDIVGDCYVLK